MPCGGASFSSDLWLLILINLWTTTSLLYNKCFKKDNDYMMNWPYFCNETSSKSTVTNRCQIVWPLHPNLRHFGRPPIAHTIDICSNDYMIKWTYFCYETSSKSTVTNRCQKVSPLHVNLRHFGRPPIAHTIDIYTTMIIWSTEYTFVMKHHQNQQ